VVIPALNEVAQLPDLLRALHASRSARRSLSSTAAAWTGPPRPRAMLAHRDVTLVAVSRAPLDDIERFRRRMGWQFKWVSSHGSDFNYNFGVSFTPEEVAKGELTYNFDPWPLAHEEWPGISVFLKDDANEVFHTYSTYARGVEVMMGTYNMLDLMPKGRDERDVGHKMEWVRHHDRY
jgi:predicted dithiol-disulfide oxidoreductase (DUF899 family)